MVNFEIGEGFRTLGIANYRRAEPLCGARRRHWERGEQDIFFLCSSSCISYGLVEEFEAGMLDVREHRSSLGPE
jgi:hypothetical protein